jgi:tRNA threonylcarbamoyladenosine biosynthesis protein TsaE
VIEMDYKITTKCEEDTMEIAENLESEKFPNMIICLMGDLGSGKTVFTKGFANALGIDENITSPTFNIIKEYTGGEANLYHMDLYRLNGDIKNLGLDEYFEKDGVVIIEWADMIEEYLPEERLDIKFKVIDEDTRVLIFKPHGTKYEELCEAIL